MTEAEFISLVDCRFPYHDLAEAHRLIKLGCSISPNAGFTIPYELARLPVNRRISIAILLDQLQEFDNCFEHPLKELVISVARRMINGEELPTSEVLGAMRQVRPYRDQYQALNVIMNSAAEPWEPIEGLLDEIRQQWRDAT